MKRKVRKHWYKTYYYECPVCFVSYAVRKRQYSDKPDDPKKRFLFQYSYDYCIE